MVDARTQIITCGHKRWTQARTLIEVLLVHFMHLVHAKK